MIYRWALGPEVATPLVLGRASGGDEKHPTGVTELRLARKIRIVSQGGSPPAQKLFAVAHRLASQRTDQA